MIKSLSTYYTRSEDGTGLMVHAPAWCSTIFHEVGNAVSLSVAMAWEVDFWRGRDEEPAGAWNDCGERAQASIFICLFTNGMKVMFTVVDDKAKLMYLQDEVVHGDWQDIPWLTRFDDTDIEAAMKDVPSAHDAWKLAHELMLKRESNCAKKTK